MDYFPIFLNLQGRTALVVGGTEAAAQKARLLFRAGATLQVVAEHWGAEMRGLIGEPLVTLSSRRFQPSDLDGVSLVIAASDDEPENRHVSDAAQARGLPFNAVDRPELCSFIMPAFVDRSPVMVAVSSGGASPVLARLVRAKIEALLPQKLGVLAGLALAFRDQVMRRLPAAARRRFWEDALEGEAADRAYAGDSEGAAAVLQSRIDIEACSADRPCRTVCSNPGRCSGRRAGEVWLVGAGPGDPDLLTNKALRLMQRCDVVLHDRLVPLAVLDRVRRDAEMIPVGKAPGGKGWPQEAINQMMIERARAGDRVLRLKCGDPMIFGRGGEERDALINAGIPVTIIPGVTAGVAAAGEAGAALTDRRIAKQCLITHGRALCEMAIDDLAAIQRQRMTLVVYMARLQFAAIKDRLLAAGFSPAMPAMFAMAVSRPEARRVVTSLDRLTIEALDDDQPVILVIGETMGALLDKTLSEAECWTLPPVARGDLVHGHR
jgi:uroporphyrin-III C-methyltransferase/precorrin-2 dehydrogenase/sirohydrochlorin ferrochelatase